MPQRTVAVFADIHGNMPALEAVLTDLREIDVDEVLVGGDLVGRGPEGSAVARRIRDIGWPSVRGNHEDYLLGFRRGEVPAHWLETDEWAASRFMASDLTSEDAAYIDALPMALTATVAPGLRLVHGSPSSNNEGLGPWSSARELERHAGAVEEGLLVCAHTHRPLVRDTAAGRVVNVGSVGLPFNGDPRAQYGLFHFREGAWSYELRQVEYDRAEILAIYESSGFLAAGGVTAQLLRREVEHAVPYLVPFLKWAEVLERAPEIALIDEFLDDYDADESLAAFYHRLTRIKAERCSAGR